jgi:hypothetical protein
MTLTHLATRIAIAGIVTVASLSVSSAATRTLDEFKVVRELQGQGQYINKIIINFTVTSGGTAGNIDSYVYWEYSSAFWSTIAGPLKPNDRFVPVNGTKRITTTVTDLPRDVGRYRLDIRFQNQFVNGPNGDITGPVVP